jgi:hypothetical protein
MGFAPKETAVGDHIGILCGGKTPYVFRAATFHYTLLGDAFLHRAMHGEVIDVELASKDPLEPLYHWIQLR